MSEINIRLDPSDGGAYTFPEVVQWYRAQGWNMVQIQQKWSTMQRFEIKKPVLRFSQGDRVMCNIGPRRLAGVILSLNVEDPEEPDPSNLIPYVVKTDSILGEEPSRTISAPSDNDMVICRERCFHSKTEMELAKWAAPIGFDKAKKPSFSVGDAVAIRVKDRHDGYEQWADGKIVEVWPVFPGPKGEGFLKFAEAVPYLVSLQDNQNQTFYCHRDEHTLIRKPENKPRTQRKTISKRFEIRKLDNGSFEKFDHVTLRGKIVEGMEESDSE
jgi:hypothetical protein